jgi:hypothetical protein
LSVSRLEHLVGDEALRATVLTLEALRQRGVAHPSRNVVVVLGRDTPFNSLFGTVLAKKVPFTGAELSRIRTLAKERGEGIAFAPGGPYFKSWRTLARSPSLHAFCSNYRLNVCAPTDDKPFFFNMRRLGDLRHLVGTDYIASADPIIILVLTLVILLVMSALAFVLPLRLVRRDTRPPLSQLLFFVAIGLGFLSLEIVLIQRFVLFLGYPTYSLSVVLFALLTFTGLGSYISTRLRDARSVLIVDLTVVALLILSSTVWLGPLLRSLIDLPFPARVLTAVAILAPFGLTMGMAMPIGLARLDALHPAGLAWAWGINGLASVLSSVLSVLIAIYFGFTATTVFACACYVFALVHAVIGRWATADSGPGPTTVDDRGRQATLEPSIARP